MGVDLLPALIVAIGGVYFLFQGYATFVRLSSEKKVKESEKNRLRKEIELLHYKYKQEKKKEVQWKGYRKFRVAKKVEECPDVYSFYLYPHDKKALPPFYPGQYLTFKIQPKGQAKPLIRCYSLSEKPINDYYRVTIKRVPEVKKEDKILPAGVVSNYFCDEVHEGDILDVAYPTGHFYLDLEKSRPVVLLSAGVGVTPVLCMANTILEKAKYTEMWFVHGSRNKEDLILGEHLYRIDAENPNFHLELCFSRPEKGYKKGKDYQHEGRVTVDVLKKILPSNNYDYYLCGPGPFMSDLVNGLEEWGVPEKNIFFEAFGPASVKKVSKKPQDSEEKEAAFAVTFKKSDKTVNWDPNLSTLLDLARESDVQIDAGCCAGNCGSCLVAIQSGEVEYLDDPGFDVEEGSCLACVCKPKGELVIDA